MKERTKRKFASFGLSLAMIASSLLSVVPAQAAEATPNVTKAQETSDSQTGKIAVKIDSGAGTVKVTTSDGKTQSVTTDEEGKASVTKSDGSTAAVSADKDGYLLTADDTAGKQVTVEAVSAKGYKVSTYKVTADAGTVSKKNEETDIIKAVTLKENTTTVLETAFTKQSTDNAQSKETVSTPSNSKEDNLKDAQGRYKVANNIVIDKATSKVVDKLVASGESPKQAWKDTVNPGTYVSKKAKAKLAATNIGGESSFSADGIFSATFVVHDGNKSYTGFCIEAGAPTPIHYHGAYNKVTVQANNYNAKMATAILAYGYGGEHSDFIARIIPNVGEQKVATMQALRQYAQGGHDQTAKKAYTNNFINALSSQVVGAGLIADTSYYYIWTANGYQKVAAGYSLTPPEGYATAHKASSNTAISDDNAQYTLDGAEYRIYSDQACTQYTGKGFHFDANGSNTWGNQKLTPGTYYAKEYIAPKGYQADTTVHTFSVSGGNTTNNPVKVNISEQPDYGTVDLQKKDLETGKTTPQKGSVDGKSATFKDAQYTFTYSDGAKKTYTWVMKTDENGEIKWDDAHYVSGDKLIKNGNTAVIPLGELTYKETKAPIGYNLDTESHTLNITNDSGKPDGKTKKVSSSERIIRGNMNWIKTKIPGSTSDGITLQGIYFKIKNNDTGEVQYVRSDTENAQGGVPGLTDTSSKTCYQYDYNPKTKTGTLLKNTDDTPKHVWFGPGTYMPGAGALTYGEYTVTEMPTAPDKSQGIEGNIGDDLARFTHEVKKDGIDTIAIKTGKNGSSTIVDYPVKIHTSASTDHHGEHTVIKGKTAAIYDNLKYENLTAGRTYKVRSVIVDKTTGQAVAEATSDLVTSEKDINKKTGNVDGSIELKIPVDTSKWQDNHDYVVTEYLSWEDMEIKNETDLSLTEQTIYPLTAHTTAADAATKDNVARASKTVTINDEVAYWGLTVGQTYTVKGTLMDKATSKPVMSNGKEVTAFKTFKAPSKSGKVAMTFTFDSSDLQGHDVVAFENVIPQNGEVYTHADINDAPQTVHIPKIGTTAKDSQTKEHIGVVGKKATLVDTVAYNNLVVGKEYTMKGKLMDKTTGKPFTVNGKEITASKTFKADKKDGSVDLTYTFDSSALQGKDLVVFEDLYHNNINVATHADIKDEGQTVHYPGVHTTATDKNTKTHTGAKDEKETIVDMVKYTNVIPGKSYTITGTLMDKETGKPYTENGKEVTATKTFTAEKADGEVELDYTVDTSALKEAKTFVVFEDLKYGDVTVVSHADLKDEGQSVNIPSGHTQAADSQTEDQVGTVGKKVTTVDHVIYTNLTPGETYTVKGTIMNPETGKALQDNGKDITAEKTFTPKEADGTVDITFTYDSSALKGKNIVVFEDVYSNGIPVIINEDLKDTNETIYYPEIHTSASAGGQKNDVKAGKIEITDTVSYKNLIPGKEYDLKGLLMDKTSGQPVKGLFGSVKGETKFTPKTADGSVEVKFSFDASQYAGKTVVVFEDLYHNDKPVTDHHDINDQAQSVSFAPGAPKTGITGNKTTLIILIVCVAAAAGAVCMVLRKKKTPDDTTKPEEKSKE